MSAGPSRPLSFLAVALTTATVASAQVPGYSVEYLGPQINAAAMNESGQVVGTYNGSTTAWHAGPGVPIAFLPLPPGASFSQANDINEAGVIVGSVTGSTTRAVAWVPDGSGGYTVQMLGLLPGDSASAATALNDVGDIVGYSAAGFSARAALFSLGGPPQDLSALVPWTPESINDERQAIGGSPSVRRVDLDTGVLEDLGLPVGSYLSTHGYAINALGQVGGYAGIATSTSCAFQAARYTDGIGWQIFSGCGTSNAVYGMNDLGDVVMKLNVAPYVRFEGLGTFLIEDLIHDTVGHWFVINGFGLTINNRRQIALPATNPVTGESGIVLLTPEPVGSLACAGDGSGGACPCGNESAPGSGEGCTHSGGVGATLEASGSASVASDDLVLHVASTPPGALGVLLQGAPAAPVPFRDGLLCAGAPVSRLQPFVASASGAAASSASIVSAGGVLPGQSRLYQAWFRNVVGPCSAGSNVSAGLVVDWLP